MSDLNAGRLVHPDSKEMPVPDELEEHLSDAEEQEEEEEEEPRRKPWDYAFRRIRAGLKP